VFEIDQRMRGLPASREQVLSVFQSINSPHLAIPGKQAGQAQAFVVGLRGTSGLAAFVYLFLDEIPDCAVYAPERRGVPVEDFPPQEAEALAFVESMGFIMDNLNFRSLPVEDQDRLLKTLPVFQREPRAAAAPARKSSADAPSTQEKLARLLSAF
jgi:hypothetical protein